VKIISGKKKGQIFNQPKSRSVRPLSEKVRAAVFDVTGPVTDFVVLDAYAGTGAAGFEALSRGARLVEAIESNQKVASIISDNAKRLGFDWEFILYQMPVTTWLASPNQYPAVPRYDLIIVDPPYAKLDPDILDSISLFLTPEGVMAVSHSSRYQSPMLKSVELVRHKVYGDTALSFYKTR
jgi:16S rRNA (guanine966-N2)-methyltransferase